jgi:tetratricopeptide (TPR) repeat protein
MAGHFVLALIGLLLVAAELPAQQPAMLMPGQEPTLRVNTTSAEARAAFDAGLDAALDLDRARAAAEFQRAYTLDSGLRLARSYELLMRGRAAALADSVDRLWALNTGSQLVENLLFMSMRERHLGRNAAANALLNAASRVAPGERRLLAEYHLWLGVGSATRAAVARSLRASEPASYRSHAYVALALPVADSAEALDAMAQALRLGASRPLAHYAAGSLLIRLRRHAEAAVHLDRALQLDPQYERAAFRRAQLGMYTRRFDETRSDLRTLASSAMSAMDRALAQRATALSYWHDGDFDSAVRELEAVATRLAGEGGWRAQIALAHEHLAVMAAARNDPAGIERHLSAASARRAAEPGISQYWAAITWSVADRPERARAALDQYEALVRTGEHVPAATEAEAIRAMVLAAAGSFTEALEAALGVSNYFAALARYQSLAGLGRDEEARALLLQLLNANDFALDTIAVPLIRHLHGSFAS